MNTICRNDAMMKHQLCRLNPRRDPSRESPRSGSEEDTQQNGRPGRELVGHGGP